MSAILPKLLVTGLGVLPKPGTRQSLAHLIVDSLSKRLEITLVSTLQGYRGDNDVLLGDTRAALTIFKSRYLIEHTGPSIRTILQREFGKSPPLLLLIFDSPLLPPREVLLTTGGGSMGNKGVQNMMSCLRDDGGFHRLQLGVGPRDKGVNEEEWGAQRLGEEERTYWMGEGLEKVLVGIEGAVRRNVERERVAAGEVKV